MLKSRWLSTFTVIGAVLIALGVVGLILGPRFVYDPGQPVTGKEAWCYLAVGALMLLNGLLTPAPTPDNSAAPRPAGKNGAKPEPTAAGPGAREVKISRADPAE